jgi:hypothetical protein
MIWFSEPFRRYLAPAPFCFFKLLARLLPNEVIGLAVTLESRAGGELGETNPYDGIFHHLVLEVVIVLMQREILFTNETIRSSTHWPTALGSTASIGNSISEWAS